MRQLDPQISEDIVSQVFALASRLYAQKNHNYSLAELMQAGAEVQIPPEFVQQAVAEIQGKHIRAQILRKRLAVVSASIGVAIALWGIWTYNTLSDIAQTSDAAWAQVENQFQRRADLVPNLVSVTQAYAQHERDLAALMSHSRQAYLQANTQSEKVAAMRELSQAIERFQAYAVKNPQLQSSRAFINLQYELVGTENRLTVERMHYNRAVRNYNQKIRLFPNSLLTSIFGFNPKSYFSSLQNECT